MKYTQLGRSGLKISRIGLGAFGFGSPRWQSWVLDREQSRPIIARAIELGINYFDTADYYSDGESEAVLGRTLRELARREEVVISTKAFHPTGPGANESGLSRVHLFNAIDRSLRNLGVDHVDLYQIHRLDQGFPMEETLEALHDIVKSGKARYIGASNMVAWQFAKALYIQERKGWVRFVSIQNQYNLLYREEEREMLPLCAAEGVGYLPYSPLARGFLARRAGPLEAEDTDRTKHDTYLAKFHSGPVDRAIRERVNAVADRIGSSTACVSVAWLLGRPGLTAPVIGATKAKHLEAAAAALDIELSPADASFLEELYQPRPVLLHL